MHARLLVGLAAACAPVALGQNLIANGSFEDLAWHPQASSLRFGLGWDAVSAWHAVGTLDALGTFLAAADGEISMDLNGGSPGRIEQAVTTVPGHLYTISFALSANMQAGRNTKEMRVVAPGVTRNFVFDPVAENATLQDPKWRITTVQFVASADASLIAFEAVSTGEFGAVIDDVYVLDAGLPGCNEADLADPFTVLNFFDVAMYVSLYNAQDSRADLAAPIGTLNFFDVAAFLNAFSAGCP